MDSPADFEIKWGRVARTILYIEGENELLFTTDLAEKPGAWITLEHHPTMPKCPIHYITAFNRVRAFLESKGSKVKIFGNPPMMG